MERVLNDISTNQEEVDIAVDMIVDLNTRRELEERKRRPYMGRGKKKVVEDGSTEEGEDGEMGMEMGEGDEEDDDERREALAWESEIGMDTDMRMSHRGY